MTNKWIKVTGEDGIEMEFEVKNIHLEGCSLLEDFGDKNKIIKKNCGNKDG